MSLQGFSKTAVMTALCRAAHQMLDDEPKILCDPIALKFIDESSQAALRARDPMILAMANPTTRSHFCLRSRLAEDCMQRAAGHGVDQYVILGAGLDTFAYRQPDWARAGKIVEVDHPRTQRFKIELIKSRGFGPPDNVRYAGVDLASGSLIDGIKQANIDTDRPIFVTCIGVTQYLEADAVSTMLRSLADWRGGCGLLMTYILGNWSDLEPPVRAGTQKVKDWAGSVGEPWVSSYSEASMAQTLRSAGFSMYKAFAVAELQSLYFANRVDGLTADSGPTRTIGAHTSDHGIAWFEIPHA